MPRIGAPISPLHPTEQLRDEPRGDSAPVKTDYAGSVNRFIAAHGLTPREGRIVELILSGYPTRRSREAVHQPRHVKNHRGRLYYKLDITTERELFLVPASSAKGITSGRAVGKVRMTFGDNRRLWLV